MTFFAAALTGFLLGGSLIVAIGPQNAFVLRMGLLRRHILPIVLFCSISDALLILAGVGGLGGLLSAHQRVADGISLGGAAFLTWYGYRAFRRALAPQGLSGAEEQAGSLRRALLTCAAFTWGNPHVYLDTVMLIGSLSLPFHGDDRTAYAMGAALASFAWFFSLGFGARLLTPLFSRPMTWRCLDLAIAAIMWMIAVRLVLAATGLTK